MDGSDVLSFVRNPAFFNQNSVHDRLYYDFTVRSQQKKLTEDQKLGRIVKKPSPMRITDSKIEDSLMRKHKAAQAKLNQLRTRYQSEELKELKAAPEINKISQVLAKKTRGRAEDVKSNYIKAIMNNSKLSKMVRSSSCSTILKEPVIKINGNSTVLYNSFQEYENSTRMTRTLSGTREKNKYLSELREAVKKRPNVLVHEEPPKLLEMSVLDRGCYWKKKCDQKLEKNREKQNEDDMKNCTFSPDITPLRGLSQVNPRSNLTLNLSYSQIYQNKKNGGMSSSIMTEKIAIASPMNFRKKKNKSQIYESLSPVTQKLSHKNGVDVVKFFKKSKIITGSNLRQDRDD